MNINADYAGCNLEEFLTLTPDELTDLESLVSEHLCSQLTRDRQQALKTLQAKLILMQSITH